MFRMFERKVVDKAKIRTIYKSETFPTTGYGIGSQSRSDAAGENQRSLFHLPLGRFGAEG